MKGDAEVQTDIRVEREPLTGGVLLRPLTAEGAAWIEDTLLVEWDEFKAALSIDPKVVPDALTIARADGLEVEDQEVEGGP
jgi:hypothetical protein